MTECKSSSAPKSTKGNTAKYYSYAEAWTRIKLAQEQGFYFEAIVLQESIISDRCRRLAYDLN